MILRLPRQESLFTKFRQMVPIYDVKDAREAFNRTYLGVEMDVPDSAALIDSGVVLMISHKGQWHLFRDELGYNNAA